MIVFSKKPNLVRQKGEDAVVVGITQCMVGITQWLELPKSGWNYP